MADKTDTLTVANMSARLASGFLSAARFWISWLRKVSALIEARSLESPFSGNCLFQ